MRIKSKIKFALSWFILVPFQFSLCVSIFLIPEVIPQNFDQIWIYYLALFLIPLPLLYGILIDYFGVKRLFLMVDGIQIFSQVLIYIVLQSEKTNLGLYSIGMFFTFTAYVTKIISKEVLFANSFLYQKHGKIRTKDYAFQQAICFCFQSIIIMGLYLFSRTTLTIQNIKTWTIACPILSVLGFISDIILSLRISKEMKTIDSSSIMSLVDPTIDPHIDTDFIGFNSRGQMNESNDYFVWKDYFFRKDGIGGYLITWGILAGLFTSMTEVDKIQIYFSIPITSVIIGQLLVFLLIGIFFHKEKSMRFTVLLMSLMNCVYQINNYLFPTNNYAFWIQVIALPSIQLIMVMQMPVIVQFDLKHYGKFVGGLIWFQCLCQSISYLFQSIASFPFYSLLGTILGMILMTIFNEQFLSFKEMKEKRHRNIEEINQHHQKIQSMQTTTLHQMEHYQLILVFQ